MAIENVGEIVEFCRQRHNRVNDSSVI